MDHFLREICIRLCNYLVVCDGGGGIKNGGTSPQCRSKSICPRPLRTLEGFDTLSTGVGCKKEEG